MPGGGGGGNTQQVRRLPFPFLEIDRVFGGRRWVRARATCALGKEGKFIRGSSRARETKAVAAVGGGASTFQLHFGKSSDGGFQFQNFQFHFIWCLVSVDMSSYSLSIPVRPSFTRSYPTAKGTKKKEDKVEPFVRRQRRKRLTFAFSADPTFDAASGIVLPSLNRLPPPSVVNYSDPTRSLPIFFFFFSFLDLVAAGQRIGSCRVRP